MRRFPFPALPAITIALGAIICFAASARADFNFGVICGSDVEAASATSRDASPKHAAPENALLQEIAAYQPAFVLDAGSVTETGDSAEFALFRTMTASALPDTPMYAVPGSRDVCWNAHGKAGFDAGMGQPLYRSFDRDTVHFLLLDTTLARARNGHIDMGEQDWLRKDLQNVGPNRPIVVCMYHAVGGDTNAIDNEDDLLQTLEPYNVRLYLIGQGDADRVWNVNGAPAIGLRDLYGGSYVVVRVGPHRLEAFRRTSTVLHPAKAIVDEPLTEPAKPQRSASVHADGSDLTVTVPRGAPSLGLPADTSVTCRLDDAAPVALDKNASGWAAVLPLGGVVPGDHRIVFRATLTDGRAFFTPLHLTLAGVGGIAPAWNVRLSALFQGALLVDGGLLYAPASDGSGLFALDAATGTVRWRFRCAALFAPPVREGSKLIFGDEDGRVYAVDSRSGKQIWKTALGAPIFAAAAVTPQAACVTGGNGRVFGLDPTNGEILWTVHSAGGSAAPPAASGNRIYFGDTHGVVHCLDAHTSAEQWKQTLTAPSTANISDAPVLGAPAVSEDGKMVFVVTAEGVLHALDAAAGAADWTTAATLHLNLSAPCVHGSRVYAASRDEEGKVYSFDAATGATQWGTATEGSLDTAAAVPAGDDFITVGGPDATVSVLRAGDDGRVQWQYHLPPEHLLSTPASDGVRVYFATLGGAIVAFPITPPIPN